MERRPRRHRILVPLITVFLFAAAAPAPGATGALDLQAPFDDGGNQRATCTNSWLGGSGSWHDETRWSLGHPPTASEGACIVAPGTYTVTIAGTASCCGLGGAGSLILGAQGTPAAVGRQTLLLGTHGNDPDVSETGTLDIAVDAINRPTGVIALDSTEGASTLAVHTPGLENRGTITTFDDGAATGGRAVLAGNIVNTGSGLVDINQSAIYAIDCTCTGNGTFVNQGRVEVADGEILDAHRFSTFTNDDTGHIEGEGDGHFRMGFDFSGTINMAGTTAGARPVLLNQGALNYTGDGASDVEVTNAVALSGDLDEDQTLTVGNAGNAGTLVADGGFTNDGEIRLVSTAGGSSLGSNTLAPFVNNGTITSIGAAPHRSGLFGNVTNTPTGLLDVNHTTTFSINCCADTRAFTLLNQGRIEVADGEILDALRTTTVTNAATGHIEGEGDGHFRMGFDFSGTINMAGTTAGARPVLLNQGALNYTGDGASDVEVTNAVALSGDLDEDQTLTVGNAGNAGTLVADGGFTNDGEIRLVSTAGGSSLGSNTLAPFVNNGTITSIGAAPHRSGLFGNVTNTPTGLLDVNHTTTFSINCCADTRAFTLLNQGRIEVADGEILDALRTTTVTNAATGHIEGEGDGHFRMGFDFSGTFNEAGTTAGTRPVLLSAGALNYTGDGASDIEVINGIQLSGETHPGQTLTIGNTNTAGTGEAPSGFSNGGRVILRSAAGSSSIQTNDSLFENSGTLITEGGPESRIGGNLTNTGDIDIRHNTRYFNQSGPADTLDNRGAIAVGGGATLLFEGIARFTQSAGETTLAETSSRLTMADGSGVNLTGGTLGGIGTVAANVTNGGEVSPGASVGTLTVQGNYTQTADGVLVAEVTDAGSDLLGVTGQATLDGTLEIETASGFTPTEGDTFEILTASAVADQFANVNGSLAGPYDVVYNPTDVTLEVISPSELPTVSVGDVSVEEGDSGETDAGFAVQLSQPQDFEVTVGFRTSNGTAYAPDDYETTSGTVTFPAGDVEESVSVPVNGDTDPEPDETFHVNLRDADGVAVGDGRGTGTILNDELDAIFISPTRGGAACCVTATVHGAGLLPGATLALSRGGEEIDAEDVSVAPDGKSLGGTLDLTGAALGPWDVTVTNPDGRGEETLTGAFTVEEVERPEVWLGVNAPSVARRNLPYPLYLNYGNTGNVDATGVVLHLNGLPSFDRIDLPATHPSGVISQDRGAGGSVSLFIDRLPPGTRYAPIVPRFRQLGTVSMRASMRAGSYDPGAVPKLDPAINVTMEVDEQDDPATTSPAVLRGTLHVTGPGGGDISFERTATNASAHTDPSFGRSEPAPGIVRHELEATTELDGQIKLLESTLEGPASAFAALRRAGNLPTALTGGRATAPTAGRRAGSPRAPAPVNPLEVAQALAALDQLDLRKKLIDCMTQQGIFDQFGAAEALETAELASEHEVVGLVPVPGGAAGSLAWQVVTRGASSHGDSTFNRRVYNALLFSNTIIPGDIPPEDATRYALDRCFPTTPGAGPVRIDRPVQTAVDPNEKAGPAGAGAERFIEGDNPLPYEIKFENLATASLPAREVVITDDLDETRLDPSTVTLGPVNFGDVYAGPPPGLKHWTTDIDLRPDQDLIVRVNGDLQGDDLTWRFEALDPETLQPPTDPSAGFLPPNDNPPEGEGSVLFSGSTVGGLPSGSEVSNRAQIVFDTEAPILTNTFLNTLDNDVPTSQVDSAVQPDPCQTNLDVAWSGSDQASGIRDYDVYVSIDGGPAALWRLQTTSTAGTYPGQDGHAYQFFSVAHDRAGHQEATPTTPDASVAASLSGCGPGGDPPGGGPPVDDDPPETTITNAPRKKSDKPKAKLKFTADEENVTFECKLDKKPFKPCGSPFKKRVKDGKHKFLVRATDAAGNVDQTPAKAKFKVVD